MTKSRTVLMIILSLVLAACVAAAGVFGVALARASLSDGTEASAGEARWKVTEKTVGEITEESVSLPMEMLRPDYKSYEAHIWEIYDKWTMDWSLLPDDDPGIRTDEWNPAKDSSVDYTVRTSEFFGVVATLRNDGDVAASVTIEDTDGFRFDTDGCGCDDERYEDEEIEAHISCKLYWSKDGTYTTLDEVLDEVKEGQEESNTITLAPGGKDVVYFYARVVWNTDLEEDMFELDVDGNFVTDTNGYKTLNMNYDGTQGDEFDTWAGQHLLGITLPVKIRAEQAE